MPVVSGEVFIEKSLQKEMPTYNYSDEENDWALPENGGKYDGIKPNLYIGQSALWEDMGYEDRHFGISYENIQFPPYPPFWDDWYYWSTVDGLMLEENEGVNNFTFNIRETSPKFYLIIRLSWSDHNGSSEDKACVWCFDDNDWALDSVVGAPTALCDYSQLADFIAASTPYSPGQYVGWYDPWYTGGDHSVIPNTVKDEDASWIEKEFTFRNRTYTNRAMHYYKYAGGIDQFFRRYLSVAGYYGSYNYLSGTIGDTSDRGDIGIKFEQSHVWDNPLAGPESVQMEYILKGTSPRVWLDDYGAPQSWISSYSDLGGGARSGDVSLPYYFRYNGNIANKFYFYLTDLYILRYTTLISPAAPYPSFIGGGYNNYPTINFLGDYETDMGVSRQYDMKIATGWKAELGGNPLVFARPYWLTNNTKIENSLNSMLTLYDQGILPHGVTAGLTINIYVRSL